MNFMVYKLYLTNVFLTNIYDLHIHESWPRTRFLRGVIVQLRKKKQSDLRVLVDTRLVAPIPRNSKCQYGLLLIKGGINRVLA